MFGISIFHFGVFSFLLFCICFPAFLETKLCFSYVCRRVHKICAATLAPAEKSSSTFPRTNITHNFVALFRRKHVFNQFHSTPIHTGATSATRNTSGQRNVWLCLTPFFTQHSLEQPQHPKVFRGHPHCVTGVSLPEPTAETHVDNYFVMRASLPVKMFVPHLTA